MSNTVQKRNILIVEDNPGSQKLMEFFLKKDYATHFAVSVDAAKKQLAAHPIDLILLDLTLVGDEDGLDLVRYVRKSGEWNNLPVIALTAHAFGAEQDNCLSAGCNDFLHKPVRKEKILEKIKEYLN